MLKSSEISANNGKAAGLRISIFGFGFLGSAIAAVWLRAGAEVQAFDISEERVNSMNRGNYAGLEESIKTAFAESKYQDRFRATSDSSCSQKNLISNSSACQSI